MHTEVRCGVLPPKSTGVSLSMNVEPVQLGYLIGHAEAHNWVILSAGFTKHNWVISCAKHTTGLFCHAGFESHTVAIAQLGYFICSTQLGYFIKLGYFVSQVRVSHGGAVQHNKTTGLFCHAHDTVSHTAFKGNH